LNAAGVQVASDALDGVDLRRTVGQSAPEPRTFFWRMGQRRALRHGDWKIFREAGRGAAGSWLLFNLTNDPAEKTDLAAQDPARVADLLRRWDTWSSTQKPPRW
jgi:arylsulfatase A-like enzyme